MTHTIHSRTAGNPQTIHNLSTGELGGCSRGHLDLHQRKEGRMDLDNLFPRVPQLDYAKRVDSCPECMARHVTPATVETVPNGAQCSYECHVCGCDWTTSWWEGEG